MEGSIRDSTFGGMEPTWGALIVVRVRMEEDYCGLFQWGRLNRVDTTDGKVDKQPNWTPFCRFVPDVALV